MDVSSLRRGIHLLVPENDTGEVYVVLLGNEGERGPSGPSGIA